MPFIPILAAGIDTAEIGFCVASYTLPQDKWDELAHIKLAAQESPFDIITPFELCGQPFIVKRSGVRRHKYVLVNDLMSVLINDNPRNGKYFPEVRITLRSEYLWQDHADCFTAIHRAVDWVSRWANVSEHLLSRVDLCVDLPLELPELSANWVEVVSYAHSKASYPILNPSDEFPASSHSDGLTLTGYTFGKGALECRIYNKSYEIMRKSHKYWFYDIWKRACPALYNTDVEQQDYSLWPTVTRTEYQLRREALKELEINTIDDLEQKIGGLWKYLTQEWLSICDPSDTDSNRSRWKPNAFWLSVISASRRFGQDVGVHRERQVKPKFTRLKQQAHGVLVSMAALTSISFGGGNPKYGLAMLKGLMWEWLLDPKNLDSNYTRDSLQILRDCFFDPRNANERLAHEVIMRESKFAALNAQSWREPDRIFEGPVGSC